MASTVKCESEPDNEVDPLSTHNEHDLVDIKQEEYLVPVVMTETEVSLIQVFCVLYLHSSWHDTSSNCDATSRN
jgi:hypothetical protein